MALIVYHPKSIKRREQVLKKLAREKIKEEKQKEKEAKRIAKEAAKEQIRGRIKSTVKKAANKRKLNTDTTSSTSSSKKVKLAPTKSIQFVCVGMKFQGNHKFKKKDVITLEADPHNRFDPNAIKVIVKSKHAAFVAKESAVKMHRILSKITAVHFEEYESKAAVVLKASYQ